MRVETLNALIGAATPFLRIDDVKPASWCRNVADRSRAGPWSCEAIYTVLADNVWQRAGEVIYFVTDRTGALRLVGQSGRRLRDRWRESPMHDPVTRVPLGRHSLFHSTALSAINRGRGEEAPPFVVSALFADDLERTLRRSGADQSLLLGPQHLCSRVEAAIRQTYLASLTLWNRH